MYKHIIALAMTMAMAYGNAFSQNACEKLFSSGTKCQQTMTISSQKQAITYFGKAKLCYDSKAKKDLCDQQIKLCRKIITQLSKANRPDNRNASTAPAAKPQTQQEPATASRAKRNDVKLALDRTYIKFKGKGGEFQKVKVTCNYPDWEVAEAPEWVNCSRNDNDEIVVEAQKNPSNKDERSGQVTVRCGTETIVLTIIQEKFKKYILF